jgi:hypothetical protein
MSTASEDAVWTLDDLLTLPDDGRRHEVVRPGRAVEVLGPLPLFLDPGTLGAD